MVLILLSALLTGFNLYGKLVKWGGAGALVPITGFANSVVASAIEYKTEGQVFGIGCKIFTIAGYGHTVWYFYKLVPWGGVLDREADGAGVNAYKKDNDHGMGHCPFFQLFIGNFLSS